MNLNRAAKHNVRYLKNRRGSTPAGPESSSSHGHLINLASHVRRHAAMLTQRRHAVLFKLRHERADGRATDIVVAQARADTQALEEHAGCRDCPGDAIVFAAARNVPDTLCVLQQLCTLLLTTHAEHRREHDSQRLRMVKPVQRSDFVTKHMRRPVLRYAGTDQA